MVAAGWNVVITHGSGPQVGFILRRSEIALGEVPPVPMDYAAADLQGAIGYMFQRALRNEFRRRGLAAQRDRRSDAGAGRPTTRRSPTRRSRSARTWTRRQHGAAPPNSAGSCARDWRGWRRRHRRCPRASSRLTRSSTGQRRLRGDRLRRRWHPGVPGRRWRPAGRGGGDRGDPRLRVLARELNAALFVISTGVPRGGDQFRPPGSALAGAAEPRGSGEAPLPRATSPKAAWRPRSARSSPTSTGRAGAA